MDFSIKTTYISNQVSEWGQVFQKLRIYWDFPAHRNASVTVADDHTGWHFCQLKTGNQGYNLHGLTKLGRYLQQLCFAIMSIWTKIPEQCFQALAEFMP